MHLTQQRAIRWTIAGLLVVAPGGGSLSAQDESESPEHALWKAAMADRWEELRALERRDGDGHELERVSAPLFTFVDATREGGHLGTMWVWGAEGRPAVMFVQSRDLQEPIWGMELVALTDGVSVTMHDGWEWTPPAAALTMTGFSNAPAAAESEARRLTQMRGLARRFDVRERLGEEHSPLRLLPTPVFRYDDEPAGLLDGAFFVFGHGTNPEAVLVIECRREDGTAGWSYGFVPLAAAAVTARLNGEEVWIKESTAGPRLQEPYSTWLEMDEM